jgi:carbon storage regulator
MLVLSRKIGEKIQIGDNIILTVVDISHNKIRLGVDAPKSIPVLREELAEELAKSNKLKAESSQAISDPISAR